MNPLGKRSWKWEKNGMIVVRSIARTAPGCHEGCGVLLHVKDGQLLKAESEAREGKLYYVPFPTDNCNLCGKRITKGLRPACVYNCWSGAMKFGTIEQLAEDMRKKPRTVLWAPH